jgi:predicted phosphohydrolase
MYHKICFISDTHNFHNKINIPECNILIHAGDFSAIGRHHEVENFLKWFNKQPAHYKIYIAGNHDISYQKEPDFKQRMLDIYPNLTYLENTGIWIDNIYIWGSPYSPEFNTWAFGYNRNEANKIWDLIPDYTTILVTHGPPKNILDWCFYNQPPYPQDAGCEVLRNKIIRIKPKWAVFGHVHESRGINQNILSPTTCMNVSICTLRYEPANKPVVIDYDLDKIIDF